MSQSQFDLAVLGAEPPGLAAAACAAAAGFRVVLIRTGKEAPSEFAAPRAPNDVWRRLGLYAAGAPNSGARPRRTWVPADEGGEPKLLETSELGLVETAALGDAAEQASAAWPDFLAASKRLSTHFGSAAEFLSDDLRGLDPSPFASADEALDDFFDSEILKAHLAVSALAPFRFAGDEPASVGALRLLAADGWPSSIPVGALSEFLTGACEEFGVSMVDGAVTEVRALKARLFQLTVADGSEATARAVVASSAAHALAMGLRPEVGLSPLAPTFGGRAFVRVTFAEDPQTEFLRNDATYLMVADRKDVRAARDAAAVGEIPKAGPLIVDLADRVIAAYAPFCPANLVEAGAERDWTGQDRQAFGRAVLERLKKTFRLKALPLSVEVRVDPLTPSSASASVVSAPPPSQDEVGAAVSFALEAARNA
ncbi:MAG: hypothetical protein AAFX08_08960 [Pseudomonadota bacterium]